MWCIKQSASHATPNQCDTKTAYYCIPGLFKACRKAPYEGQELGWWCPLPPIGEGETHDYSRNCNHDPFKRGHGLLVHYVREHFDWGLWKGEPRKARTSGCDSLSCPTCGCCFMSLEEMDKHTIESDKCTLFDLHPVKEVWKCDSDVVHLGNLLLFEIVLEIHSWWYT